jgi:hypothetical protein
MEGCEGWTEVVFPLGARVGRGDLIWTVAARSEGSVENELVHCD